MNGRKQISGKLHWQRYKIQKKKNNNNNENYKQPPGMTTACSGMRASVYVCVCVQ